MSDKADMFGDRLRSLRKERGVTQDEVARAIGVERSSIGKYEGKDRIFPSNDVLNALADYFDVSVDYLMGRDAYDANNFTILARGAKKLNEDDQKKLLDVARALFGKVFDD